MKMGSGERHTYIYSYFGYSALIILVERRVNGRLAAAPAIPFFVD